MNKSPRISIGMPAYNAAATIRSAIEALLAQSFGDWELIVSDNASTDATRDTVEDLARRDGRIRYVRHPVNIGANLNYSHAFKCARGEFFKWASSSDWCAPSFLERCLEALQPRPDAVLAAPCTRLFQGDASSFRDYAYDIEILDDTPSQRLSHLMSALRLNNAINGLIRSAALRGTDLIAAYMGADIVLMGHLALLGKMLRVDEGLYYRRMEISTSTALQDSDALRRHHYPEMGARTLFQASKRSWGWLRCATAAPMSVAERWRVYWYVARMIFWDRRALLEDLRGILRYVTGGFTRN